MVCDTKKEILQLAPASLTRRRRMNPFSSPNNSAREGRLVFWCPENDGRSESFLELEEIKNMRRMQFRKITKLYVTRQNFLN